MIAIPSQIRDLHEELPASPGPLLNADLSGRTCEDITKAPLTREAREIARRMRIREEHPSML